MLLVLKLFGHSIPNFVIIVFLYIVVIMFFFAVVILVVVFVVIVVVVVVIVVVVVLGDPGCYGWVYDLPQHRSSPQSSGNGKVLETNILY